MSGGSGVGRVRNVGLRMRVDPGYRSLDGGGSGDGGSGDGGLRIANL